MTIIGVPMDTIREAADKYGFKLQDGRGVGFALRPNPSSPNWQERYRISGYQGRKVNAVSPYGHYLFFQEIYAREPKAVIKSFLATFKSATDLHLYARNGGLI